MPDTVDATASLLLQQVLSQQGQIATDVSAIRSDVAGAIARLGIVENSGRVTDRDVADHEARIRVLERFRYTLVGAAIILGTLAGYGGSLLAQLAHH